MTARTRQAAACLEAAERDIRAMQTGAVLDSIWRSAELTDNAKWFERNAAAIAQIRADRLAEGGEL